MTLASAARAKSSSAAAQTDHRSQRRYLSALTMETVAGLRKAKLRDLSKVDGAFTFAAAAYDLMRLPKLLGVRA